VGKVAEPDRESWLMANLSVQRDAFLPRSSGLLRLSGECLGNAEIAELNREREGRPFSPYARDDLAVQPQG